MIIIIKKRWNTLKIEVKPWREFLLPWVRHPSESYGKWDNKEKLTQRRNKPSGLIGMSGDVCLNSGWASPGRDAPDSYGRTCILIFSFCCPTNSHLHYLPRGRMLLDLWEGLNTKCLAMASPTEVTKVQEVQASLIPLRKRAKSINKCTCDPRDKIWGLIKKRQYPFSSFSN